MIEDTQDEAPRDEETPEQGAPEGSATPEEAAGEDATPEEVAPEEPAEDVPLAADDAGAAAPSPEDAAGEPPATDEPRADEPATEPPATDEPPATEEPAAGAPAGEDPRGGEAPRARAPKPRSRRDRRQGDEDEPEVIPGAHLEPDLVLEEPTGHGDPLGELAGAEIEAAEQALEQEGEAAEEGTDQEPAPRPTTVLDLAADARYRATGKRKQAVARVILKPGTGAYTVNGRDLDAFFPRPTLQTIARQPLQAAGQADRMDVVAKIHGGGVSSQAGALRHGIARALVEADPNLRGEMKGRGFLTRDARVKERKKAGLKKARKRPQFSKR